MDKKQKFTVAVMIPLYVVLMAYLSGLLVQIYQSSVKWQSSTLSENMKLEIEMNLPKIIEKLLTKEGLLTWLFATVFIAALVYFIMLARGHEATDEKDFKYAGDGTYGTAEWMSEKERNKVFKIENVKKAEGIILQN